MFFYKFNYLKIGETNTLNSLYIRAKQYPISMFTKFLTVHILLIVLLFIISVLMKTFILIS